MITQIQTLSIHTKDLPGFSSLGDGATLFALFVPSLAGPIAGKRIKFLHE
jgi:hypothetical protein